MTAPTPNDQGSQQPPQQPAQQGAAKRLRVGQVVTFRHPDPTTGDTVEGHGLVIRVPADAEGFVTVAPLSLLHLFVEQDNVAPAKAESVPTLQEPQADEPAAS